MAGVKLEEAKRAIVRFIREEALREGDRLPSHADLRRRLKFSTDTVHSAVRELRDDGVLEVRNKVGAFVRDVNADGHIAGTIGIALYDVLCNSAFNNYLVNNINVQLNAHGYQTRLFSTPTLLQRPAYRRFEELPGLSRCVRTRQFDALLSLVELSDEATTQLTNMRIPNVIFCTRPDFANGIGIDYVRYLHEAFRELQLRGCRHIAMVSHFESRNYFTGILCAVAAEKAPEIRISSVPEDNLAYCRQLAATPQNEWPDGLLSVDDTRMLDLTLALFRLRFFAFQPWIANLSNARTTLSRLPFANRIDYSIDEWALASFIVTQLFELLKTNQGWQQPRLYRITKSKPAIHQPGEKS